ncbi:RagB/SusD family nutrient uptake outer membrane protein [Flavicella marina]|uniref:RagB/SusD family nutrient uptake outer membrane protein n=1 Tax=Flavicella marina TaxID=1475951 RepID=UPI0012654A33|nr:RagB/SusD family nutrient uptake outer membrane protein [Flavicella marina]
MIKYIKTSIACVLASTLLFSCISDLDQTPIDPDSFTELDVFANPTEAKSALAKVYAAFALTGQKGPDGDPDISGIDEGSSQYTRMLHNFQELTTDHAVNGWGNPGLPDLHAMSWTSSNGFVEGMYYRLAQSVSFANSFIENAQVLAEDDEVKSFIAEARFLRAYAYYNLMDLFANVPLVTKIQTELPQQSNRKEIFAFIETELKEIEGLLKNSRANEYGRVDETAAQALLSRMYLNAEVFIGENRYSDCITYSNKVISSGYSIHMTDVNGNGTAYDDMFLADSDSNGAQNEFIFTISFDGIESQTWGGVTYLVHASIGGTMNPTHFGVNGGWAGLRTTKALVSKFEANATNGDGEPIAWADKRAMFHTDQQNYEITTIANTFEDGYAITKFKNVDKDGNAGSDPNGDQVDMDTPMIRLAEIYLNYAEAVVRGGTGGSIADATNYINILRTRGYGDSSGNITSGDVTLDFILDERSRELYWEGLRRTDLIRYDRFTTGDYLWPFKGDLPDGTAVSSHRNIYPIPANAILVNPNLTQNPQY